MDSAPLMHPPHTHPTMVNPAEREIIKERKAKYLIQT